MRDVTGPPLRARFSFPAQNRRVIGQLSSDSGLALVVPAYFVCAGSPEFVERLCGIVAATGVNPEQLTLEITGSAVLFDVNETAAKLRQIRPITKLQGYFFGRPMPLAQFDEWHRERQPGRALAKKLSV